jgi:type IV pilus assembly protein PilB
MNILSKSKKKEKNPSGGDLDSSQLGPEIEILNKAPKKIEDTVIGLIPQEVAKKNQLVAFERQGNLVKVAMVDPQNIDALNLLRFIGEKEEVEFKVCLAGPEIVREMLEFYIGPTEMVKEAVKSFKEDVIFSGASNEEDDRRKEEVLADAPVTKLVQVIISHAIEGHASDIHIEPMESGYRVRFRVDGVLHMSLVLPKEIGPVVISRVKILANLKIDEKRKPQDGRFRLTSNGKEIDFRVSTLPVIDGEKAVLRILDKEEGVSSVESLGLLGSAQDNMKLAIKETYGMVLITGPTGSGKSTTLYALLKILNNEERNIITLEDPIEYNIEGLNQSQIKPEIGYTFASGLRTILRQDPNIIMVGEIRDSETAELAVHAALTGHLMFSTLHTNTAIGAIPRLIDMGIEPFLLSSALRMVVAQRLVRRICKNCKKEKELSETIREKVLAEIKNVPPEELEKYGLDMSGGAKFYHGDGCDTCSGTGLKGRVAIYEVVPVTDAIKNVIEEKQGNDNLLRQERDRMGILTIRQDGILKALLGLTTLEEVERVTEGKIGLAEEDV